MPLHQLVGVFLLVRELSTYFLQDILKSIEDYREQIKVKFVLKLCLLYLLFTGAMLFHVVNLSSYVFVAVCLFLTLNILTPFIIKYTGSVYLPTKILLLGAFVCIAHIHVVIGNAEGLGIVLWYLIIILSATFVLDLGWGIFYTVFSLGIIAFFNTTVYLDLGLLGNSELTGLKRLIMYPFRVGLPVVFLVVIAKEFLNSREAAEKRTTQLLKEQINLIDQKTESEREYRELIEEAADMIFKVDTSGNFFYVNPTFLETTGYERQEIIGRNANSLLCPKHVGDLRKFFKNQIANQQQTSHQQFRIITKSGEKIWIDQKTKMIFDPTGKRLHSFCVARNITKIKEIELLREKAKKEAERQNEMKNNFMSTVSHELRTPLNAVVALGHNLLEKEDRREQKEDLQTLLCATDNLLEIIKGITSISMVENGQLKVNPQPFCLAQLMETLLKTTHSVNNYPQVTIEVQVDPNIPAHLIGDKDKLLQVLNNLVENALKFTKSGSVQITVSLSKETSEKANIYFEVQDSGIGIEPHLLDRIFDRFTQGETSLSRSYGGVGIGLSVVKDLLQLLDSEIKVTSKVGEGSTFFFTISFKKQLITSQLKTHPPIVIPTKEELKDASILLVEDNKVNQLVAMKFLKKWKAKVVLADNGQVAVEKVRAQNFDLIMMDLEMPIMNGIEVSAIIRDLPQRNHIPIIAVTASVANNMMDGLFSNHFTDIVTKPYKPNDLYQKLAMHLTKQKSKTLQD